MDIAYLTGNCIELPGRAGELQRARATAGLIREVGDNYPAYHEHLQWRLAEIGGDPDPMQFADDVAEYVRRAATVQRIVAGEIVLRRARAHRRQDRPLSDPLLGNPPLWDADGRLVDVEHPERSTFRSSMIFGPQGTIAPPPRFPELP